MQRTIARYRTGRVFTGPTITLLVLLAALLTAVPGQQALAATALTVIDQFNAIAYTNNNGTANWRGPWYEVGEADGAGAGSVLVAADSGSNRLRISNANRGAYRQANLAGATVATLSFDYRRVGLDDVSDYVIVEISAAGASGPWTELVRYQGAGADAAYVPASFNITPYTSSRTTLRLRSSATLGNTDYVYFDDISIAFTVDGIGGTVFKDYNSDGVYNTVASAALPAIDGGVTGITVTAYDATGAVAATATTNAYGDYRLPLASPVPYRIEFSGWPAYLQPAALGADNSSSVQFVSGGDRQNVSFGLFNPSEYCQDNPGIASSCFSNGDPMLAPSGARPAATLPWFVVVPYTPPTSGPADNIYRATGQQIGATWGIAYQRSSRTLFAAAVMKRHSGFGPGGIGAIYRIDPSGASAPSVLADLNNAAYPAGANVGANPRVAGDLTADSGAPNRDPSAFDAVGKIGIGGITLSDDESTLWAINLASRSLVEIRLGVPAAAPAAADITVHSILASPTAPTCASGEFRPWAVKSYQGQVYVGGVCSGELPYAGKSTSSANLRAYILRHDPAGADGNFTPIFDFPLNYPRGYLSTSGAVTPGAAWLPWINEWGDIGAPMPLPNGGPFGQTMYPQPMLTAIEFDTDGAMVLGFNDRAGMQLGNENYGTNDNVTYEGVAGGDTLRLCADSTAPGGYSLEQNGACPGGIIGSGPGNSQGPGNGEFFAGDTYTNTHQEVTIGGLASHPGRRQVVSTVYDPDPSGPYRSGGLRWFSTTDGTLTDNYVVFGQDQVIGSTDPVPANNRDQPSSFGKASGLGDVELLCDQAPLQIGNRVWQDSNGNGVQDADEPGLPGVTVELWRAGVRVGVATTDTSGVYTFSSGANATDANTTDNIIHDGGIGIRPRTGTPGGSSDYELRIPNATGAGQQAALSGASLALTGANASSGPNSDSRDSDGTLSGTNAVYPIPYAAMAGAGYTRHTSDFGFTPLDWGDLPDGNNVGSPTYNTNRAGTPGPSHQITAALRIGATEDGEADGQPSPVANGDDSAAADDEDGVTLPVFDAVTEDVIVAVQNTTGSPATLYGFIDFNGDGDFNDLNETVTAPVPNGTAGDVTLTFTVPAGADTTQSLGARFRLSTSVALGPDGPAPDGEVEDYLITVLPYSLGNRVWADSDNSGTIDGAEAGIDGVTVNLYFDANNDDLADGARIATTVTANGGYYRFDNLIASNYIVEVVTPVGYVSSTGLGQEAAPNTNGDNNDNGTVAAGANVRSAAVTLSAPEPIGETDLGPGGQGASDNRANMTVDFGFFRGFSLGNRVWEDSDNSGTIDGAEVGIDGVTAYLYRDSDSNGTPDGAAIAATTTAGGGYYRFDTLPANTYIVEVVTPVGYSSSTGLGQEADPNTDGDNNDNGTVAAGVNVRSAPVTLGTLAAPVEPLNEGDLGPGGQGGTDDNRANMTVDFGFARTYSLGNRVWDDTNNNGALDASEDLDNDGALDAGEDLDNDGILDVAEAGINGVTVNLYLDSDNDGTPDGAVIATTTTTGGGYYRFDNRPADTYIVEVVPPAGYVSSSNGEEADPDSNFDSNDNGTVAAGANVRSAPVTLGPGGVEPTAEGDSSGGQGTTDSQANMTVDFGFFTTYSLGNRVWLDSDNDGLIGAAEAGLDGVTVYLYRDSNGNGTPDNGVIATVVTAGGGYYRFDNLPAGTYIVEAAPPAGYSSSTVNAGDPDTDADDSDDNGTVAVGANVRSTPVTLGPGDSEPDIDNDPAVNPEAGEAPNNRSNRTVDFGFYGTDWGDLPDGNAVAGSPNYNTDSTGTAGPSHTIVAGLRIGATEDAETNGQPTSTANGDDTAGLAPDDEDGVTLPAFLVGQPASVTVAVRNTTGAAATLYGFIDFSGDGDFADAGEAVTAAVADGTNGTVSLNFTVPAGASTTQQLGARFRLSSNAALGPNGPATNGEVEDYLITVTPADWGDLPDGNAVAGSPNYNSDTTGTAGPSHAITSGLGIGANEDAETNGQPTATANGDDTTGAPDDEDGVTLPGFIAGQPASVTVAVRNTTGAAATLYGFIDFSGDGDFADAGEAVTAAVANGTVGDVFLNFSVPAGASTTQQLGARFRLSSAAALGPDGPAPDGEVEDYLITALLPYSLGNRVWLDVNNDGTLDAGETGLDGVIVRLLTGAGAPVADQLTANGGYYRFDGLAAGDYIVEIVATNFDPEQPLENLNSSSRGEEADPNSNGDSNDNGTVTVGASVRSGTVALGPGAVEPTTESDLSPSDPAEPDAITNLSVDFGFYRTYSLGNRVWLDLDNSGTINPADGTDPGLDGVTVRLLTAAGAPATDADGNPVPDQPTADGGLYRFDNLLAGSYIVEIVTSNFTGAGQLVDFISSTGLGQEADPNTDGDNNDNGLDTPVDGAIRSASLSLGEGSGLAEPIDDEDGNTSNQSVDFGFFNPASIGDRVWLDLNADGVQVADEPGVPGVPVTLLRPGADGNPGTGDDVTVTTTTTGLAGDYRFDQLPTGAYFVRFGLPAGYERSPLGPGSANDSDADPVTGDTAVTTLDPGENDPTWDAGIFYGAGLGDRVWLDRNANGVQDAGEPGVANVTVTLRDGEGMPIDSALTDASGFYSFPRLPAGDYSLSFGLLDGYRFSPAGQGSDPGADSDADPDTGDTPPTTLDPNEADPTWDAGLYQPVSLGNLIWEDINNNGRVDPGEPGLPNVSVRLYPDANGDGTPDSASPLRTTSTDASGGYLFADLAPGSYVVEIVPPVGYVSSTGTSGVATGTYEPAPGPDNNADSDDNGSVAGTSLVRSRPVTVWSQDEPAAAADGDDTNGNMTVDFGLFRPAALGSIVWFDRDGDGRQETGEPGVSGVTVELLNADGTPVRDGAGQPIIVTTDADGHYLIDFLVPGDYIVRFGNLPDGYTFTTPGVGDETGDSDADPITGRTAAVSLTAGRQNLDLWAGLINPTAVSLTSFTAEREGEGVTLRWTTGAEWETWGFHILRSADGTRAGATRVTPSLILSEGGPQLGAPYNWVDTTAAPGLRYSYWLEEIELDGGTNEYGPATLAARTAGSHRAFIPLIVR